MDIRIAAYGVIVDGDKILLAHWNEHGRDGWTLPGGGVEGTEHPADAAVREIFEETGFHAELDHLLGVDNIIVPAASRTTGTNDLYALRVIYLAHVVGGELRHEVDGSSDEARWVPLDDVSTLKRVNLLDVALDLYRSRPAIGRLGN